MTLKQRNTIILHHSVKRGEDVAKRLGLTNYLVITPKTLKRCRGYSAERLLNPAGVSLRWKEFETLQECFAHCGHASDMMVQPYLHTWSGGPRR